MKIILIKYYKNREGDYLYIFNNKYSFTFKRHLANKNNIITFSSYTRTEFSNYEILLSHSVYTGMGLITTEKNNITFICIT